jgi:hypothetical protein
MGRVLAAQHEEVVIDRLYPGYLQLTKESRQNKLTNFSASVFVLGCEMQKR